MGGSGKRKDSDRKVAAVRTVPPEEADAELARAYRRVAGSNRPANIYQSHSLNPAAMVAHGQLYKAVMFAESPLSRIQRELVATVVSYGNECHY